MIDSSKSSERWGQRSTELRASPNERGFLSVVCEWN